MKSLARKLLDRIWGMACELGRMIREEFVEVSKGLAAGAIGIAAVFGFAALCYGAASSTLWIRLACAAALIIGIIVPAGWLIGRSFRQIWRSENRAPRWRRVATTALLAAVFFPAYFLVFWLARILAIPYAGE
ncbi:MAG: hypothetical protein R3F11_23705 [Verrucomicrobiales bacterium]